MELALSARALRLIDGADTIIRRGIDVTSVRRDLDGLLSRYFPDGYTNEGFVLLAIGARQQVMHAVHRAALAGVRKHSTPR